MFSESPVSIENIDAIIAHNAPTVMRVAYAWTENRQMSEDVFQEVFLRYVRVRPEFESGEHEKAWFIRVTINCCKKARRTAWHRKTVGLENDIAHFDHYRDADIENALAKLPEIYRVVIYLYYFEGMPVEKIGEALHTKQPTIRARLTRARHQLKEILGDEDE